MPTYETYIASDEWKAKRAIIMKRADGWCEGCGKRRAAQVHHKTYRHLFKEQPEDLIALCVPCHQKKHPDKFKLLGRPSPLGPVPRSEPVEALTLNKLGRIAVLHADGSRDSAYWAKVYDICVLAALRIQEPREWDEEQMNSMILCTYADLYPDSGTAMTINKLATMFMELRRLRAKGGG